MESGYSKNKIANLSDGTKMHRIGYGTWQNMDNLDALVKEAIKVGYRHIDTAIAYGNEDQVGKGIKQAIEEGLVKREDLFVTTKVMSNKGEIEKAVNQSLKKLQLDYIDLVLIHWPMGDWNKEKKRFDQVPLHVTWKQFEDVVKAGKIRSIGVSNFNVQLILDLLSYAEIKPVCNQVEIHPYLIQEDLVNFCKQYNIEVVAYCPLGGNVPGQPEFKAANLVEEPVIKEIAAKYNKTPGQVILNWHLSRGYVVIPKTATVSRLPENFQADTFELTPEELKKVSGLNKNARVCDPKGMDFFGNVQVFA